MSERYQVTCIECDFETEIAGAELQWVLNEVRCECGCKGWVFAPLEAVILSAEG